MNGAPAGQDKAEVGPFGPGLAPFFALPGAENR